MNGSGCINCPVKDCQTMHYRGSTCAAQRAKYGLGDPLTNADQIHRWDIDNHAEFLHAVHLGFSPWCDHHCQNECDDGCDNCIKNWLQQSTEGTNSENN